MDERAKVIEELESVKETLEIMRDKQGVTWVDNAIALLKGQPAVDAVPVVHARWIETTIPANTTGHGGVGQDKKKDRLCSNCRCAFDAVLLWCDSFCQNCGAKMDGERRDDDARISEAPGGGGDRQAAAV